MSVVGTAKEHPCPDCSSMNTYSEFDTKTFELFLDCHDCGTHMHLIRRMRNVSSYHNALWEEEE